MKLSLIRRFPVTAALCAAMSATTVFAAGTLPAGYIEVEYIQGNGSSTRIVTDYTPHPQTDKIEAVVEWPSAPSRNQAIWCARSAGTVGTYTLFVLNNSGYKFRFDYKSTTGNNLTPVVESGTKYTVTVDRNAFTWSGGDGQTHTPVDSFTEAGGPAVLFASYTGTPGSSFDNYGQYRLYSFKVWRSGELIHYFVPCKDSGGVATMVDICDNPATLTASGGTFFAGPAGHLFDDSPFAVDEVLEVAGASGRFGDPSPAYGKTSVLAAGETVSVSCGASPCTNGWGMIEYVCTGWKLYDYDGNELTNGTETAFTYTHPSPAAYRKLEWQWTSRKVAMFPTGYTECECIVVTNGEQYIDTLYKPNLTTDIEAHFEVPNFASMNPLYWTREQDGVWTSYGFILTANAGNTRKVRAYRLSSGDASLTTTLVNAPSTDIRISTAYSGGGATNTFTFNGETVGFAAKNKDSLSYPIYLFRLDSHGSLESSVKSVAGTKLYSFKILENGVVQKQFVPCLREADSVAGLYDVLIEDPTSAFYVNAGTGGSFGYEEKDTSAVTLTVMGSPSQMGTPFPAYGVTNLTAGAAFVAEMPQVAVTNYLTGEERELLGWTLAVTRSSVTETTSSTDLDSQRCVFTPQEGDEITLTWRWSSELYGARTLPGEYEATECLTLTDWDQRLFAFVNTGYVPSLDDQLVAVIEPTANGNIFCSRESHSKPAAKPNLTLFLKNGQMSYMCGTASDKENLGAVLFNLRTAFAINGRGLYKDGEVVDARFGETALDLEWPLTIGASYSAYDSVAQRVYGINNPMAGKIYVFKVWASDGTPRMDLRPCTRRADGARGLYDTVRGVFCPLRRNPLLTTSGDPSNLGTPLSGEYGAARHEIGTQTLSASTFTARFPAGEQLSPGGEAKYEVIGWTLRTVDADGVETVVTNDAGNVDVCEIPVYFGDAIYLTWRFRTAYLKPAGPNMPQRYSEVAWMDFTGSYVVTDYVPHPDRIKMTTDFQLMSEDMQGIFFARTESYYGCYSVLLYSLEGESDNRLQFRVKDAGKTILFNPPLGERLTLCSETNTVWIKDMTEKFDVGTFDENFTAAGSPLVFGATQQRLEVFGNYSTMRFFGSKIWEKEGGAYRLVHDYRPSFDRLTGASGLYDVVDGVFFPNATGTHFVFGKKTFGLILSVR